MFWRGCFLQFFFFYMPAGGGLLKTEDPSILFHSRLPLFHPFQIASFHFWGTIWDKCEFFDVLNRRLQDPTWLPLRYSPSSFSRLASAFFIIIILDAALLFASLFPVNTFPCSVFTECCLSSPVHPCPSFLPFPSSSSVASSPLFIRSSRFPPNTPRLPFSFSLKKNFFFSFPIHFSFYIASSMFRTFCLSFPLFSSFLFLLSLLDLYLPFHILFCFLFCV